MSSESIDSKNGKSKILIKLAISVGLIVYMLTSISWKSLSGVLAKVNISYVMFVLGLVILGVMVSAKKWHILLKAQDVEKNYLSIVKLYFIGLFFNSFLPSEIGGDVVKGYKLSKSIPRPEVAYSSIFMDRFLGVLALIVLGISGSTLLFLKFGFISKLIILPIAILIGASLSIWLFFSNMRFAVFLHKIAVPLMVILRKLKLEEKLIRLYKSINFYFGKKKTLASALAFSFLFQFLSIISVFIISRAYGYSVDMLYFFVIVPVVSCIVILPFSIHGIGLRETAYVLLFSQVGIPKAGAFMISITVYFVVLLGNLIGGLIYLKEG